jgi:hypothetical protein
MLSNFDGKVVSYKFSIHGIALKCVKREVQYFHLQIGCCLAVLICKERDLGEINEERFSQNVSSS